ncbi:MAG: M1 family metallopeptidase [Bacteroidales bacterium]|nr:M1 family metallopeptidase [Bacteroidales bacterium]
MKKILLLSLKLISLSFLFAQTQVQNDAGYNPKDFYLPTFNPPPGNSFRSANGTPGPAYWQNTADYLIHASLNAKDTTINADVTITYTNNSPDRLDYLWLQLDQNVYEPSSRSAAATSYLGSRWSTSGYPKAGYHVSGVTVHHNGENYLVKPLIEDTRMQLRLLSPMTANGDRISITINYSFFIPGYGSDRMGRISTPRGQVFELAQWFPRMCVYDDVEGWNTLPYMGVGEFYCEYGNFDYYITAPSDMIVYGSGDLQNPEQVLTPEENKRLALASKSDKTVTIISPEEIGKRKMPSDKNGSLTWHFTMKNSRDIAWVASNALVWDAASVHLPSGRTAMAMSAYLPESAGKDGWSRATEYLKESIEYYSREFFEYPWNNAVNIGAWVTGMEYPGMIFCSPDDKTSKLWFLISHEIGHNWYPMLVGSNERKYMWQDEGFNSYINYRATEVFNQGEYKNDDTLYNENYWANLNISKLPLQHDELMVVPEAMDLNETDLYYGKTAYGLNVLRNVVLGKERFDYAFQYYTKSWAFKHPTPYDFFNCMNNAAGDDLNWFWKEWFYTTWTLDQAVTAVKYYNNDPSKGILITIENKGKMILPCIIEITQTNGKKESVQLPVEIWQRGGTWTFRYASTGIVDKVILDPEHVLPDVNRKNNEWNRSKQ